MAEMLAVDASLLEVQARRNAVQSEYDLVLAKKKQLTENAAEFGIKAGAAGRVPDVGPAPSSAK